MMPNHCLLFFCCAFLLTRQLKAQSGKQDIDFIYSRPQFRFSLNTLLCAKAAIVPISGSHQLYSSAQTGFEGSVNYLLTIDRNWSFLTGLNLGVIGRNYDVNIAGSDFSPPLGYDLNNFGSITGEKDVWYVKVPALIQKRWWLAGKHGFVFLEGGGYIGFGLNPASDMGSDYAYYANGDPVNYLNTQTNLNNNGHPWIGLTASVGYQWLLKNLNFINIHAGFNYSDASVANGSYTITIPGRADSFGEYQVKDQSLQLGVSYQLSKARKRSKEIN